jgi:hypothetical protein
MMEARLAAIEQGSATPDRLGALPVQTGLPVLAVITVGALGVAYVRRRTAR